MRVGPSRDLRRRLSRPRETHEQPARSVRKRFASCFSIPPLHEHPALQVPSDARVIRSPAYHVRVNARVLRIDLSTRTMWVDTESGGRGLGDSGDFNGSLPPQKIKTLFEILLHLLFFQVFSLKFGLFKLPENVPPPMMMYSCHCSRKFPGYVKSNVIFFNSITNGFRWHHRPFLKVSPLHPSVSVTSIERSMPLNYVTVRVFFSVAFPWLSPPKR